MKHLRGRGRGHGLCMKCGRGRGLCMKRERGLHMKRERGLHMKREHGRGAVGVKILKMTDILN